jgi:hypothetical protein
LKKRIRRWEEIFVFEGLGQDVYKQRDHPETWLWLETIGGIPQIPQAFLTAPGGV